MRSSSVGGAGGTAKGQIPAGDSRLRAGSPDNDKSSNPLDAGDGSGVQDSDKVADVAMEDSSTPTSKPKSALRNSSNSKVVLDQEALSSFDSPRFRNSRPLNTLGETICTISSKHRNKDTSPSVKVHSDLKLVFSLVKKLDPAARIVPLYDEIDEEGAIIEPPIETLEAFPKELMDLAGHAQVSNTWSLIPVSGIDKKTGKPKKQADSYTYIKLYTWYCIEHLSSYMQGKLAERGCSFRVKEMQSLATKTRYALIGTWNQLCTQGIMEACMTALPAHEAHMIRNQGKNKKYMGQDFPNFMVRRSNVRLPDLKHISSDDARYLDYYYHLRYGPVFEVADSDWERFSRVMESFDAAGGFKRIISENCHLLELIQGNIANAAKIEWCKKMKLHMNFNHNYTCTDLPGVVMLEKGAYVEMADGSAPPFKKTHLKRELLLLAGKEGRPFINGVMPICAGRNKGMISVVYYNSDANQSMIDKMEVCFNSFMFQYMLNVRRYSRRCVLAIMEAFSDEDKLAAMDSSWDAENFCVKTLRSTSTNNFIGEMTKLGLLDIPAELLAEMNKSTDSGVPRFDTDAMERVAEAMRFTDKEGCSLTNVDGGASRLSDASHSTNGQESNRTTTTEHVQRDLPQLRIDFNRLKLRLRDIAPEDPLFEESFFSDDPLDGMELDDSASADLKTLHSLTKRNIVRLRSRIAEIEQGSPRLSGSAVPSPDNGGSGMAQEL